MQITGIIAKHLNWHLTADHLHIDFGSELPVLSSAVLNGGYTQAQHFLNMRVTHNPDIDYSAPSQTLKDYCDQLAIKGTCCGMMTAAYMDSFRIQQVSVADEEIAVFVTTGIGNARRVGDPADEITKKHYPRKIGTINLLLATTAALTPAAQAEALMMVTEAKAAALQNLQILSPVSGLTATGTGTDSVAIVSNIANNNDLFAVPYVGKHLPFGEALGKTVISAIESSLENETAEEETVTVLCD